MSDRPRTTWDFFIESAEALKDLTTIAALILAGIWTYFTFVQERSAPVNVTTELEVREVGNLLDSENNALVAVEVKVTARNPGQRIVWLLPSYLLAQGVDVVPGDQPGWTEAASTSIETRRDAGQGRYYHTETPQLIAADTAFTDEFLQPGETISRSILLYIPADQFDAVRVKVVIPSAHRSGELALDYTVTPDGGFSTDQYELGPGDARTKINNGDYLYRRHGLQWSISERQLPLPFSASTRQLRAASPAD